MSVKGNCINHVNASGLASCFNNADRVVNTGGPTVWSCSQTAKIINFYNEESSHLFKDLYTYMAPHGPGRDERWDYFEVLK